MKSKFGAYLIIPLKYDEETVFSDVIGSNLEKFELTTMDINENIKNMFNHDGDQSIGSVYSLPSQMMLSYLCDNNNYCFCCVINNGASYPFEILNSYLYVFHTKIAFLCLGISFSSMQTLRTICNPGYAENSARFVWIDKAEIEHEFFINTWLENLCSSLNLHKFYNSSSSMLLEAYSFLCIGFNRYHVSYFATA